MSTEFDNPNPYAAGGATPQKKGMSGCAIAGIGCGVVAFILLIAAGVGVYYVSTHGRQLATRFATGAMKDGLAELDIPQNELQRINSRIDEIGNKFKSGEIELDEVQIIARKFADSPLLSAGIALFFKRAYLDASSLSEDEKQAGKLAARRFVRGGIDQSIPEHEREAVLDLISTKDSRGSRKFRNKLSDAEIREVIAAMTQAADDAGIPADVPEINMADEFDRIIDEAMNEISGN